MQAITLKNIHVEGIALIGGTSLVLAENNPRFSEDIDLTGVENPATLLPYLKKGSAELEAFLGFDVLIKLPKKDKTTWKIFCRSQNLTATLHIDNQKFKPLTTRPLMVEFPGIPSFVFTGVKIEEIMADKLLAIAFRNNLSGRDIFDLWFHWFRHGSEKEKYTDIIALLKEKLKQRKLSIVAFNNAISSRLKTVIPARVVDEWNRYLPVNLKNEDLFKEIFAVTSKNLEKMKI